MCSFQSVLGLRGNYGPSTHILRTVPSSETYIVWDDDDDDEIVIMLVTTFPCQITLQKLLPLLPMVTPQKPINVSSRHIHYSRLRRESRWYQESGSIYNRKSLCCQPLRQYNITGQKRRWTTASPIANNRTHGVTIPQIDQKIVNWRQCDSQNETIWRNSWTNRWEIVSETASIFFGLLV